MSSRLRLVDARAFLQEGVEAGPYKAVGVAMEVIPRTLAQNCGANVVRTLTKLRAQVRRALSGGEGRGSGSKHDYTCAAILGDVGCVPLSLLPVSRPAARRAARVPVRHQRGHWRRDGHEEAGHLGAAGRQGEQRFAAGGAPHLNSTRPQPKLRSPACPLLLTGPQTQTMKTAVESAQMLLRIDDIVSGIRRKQQAGPQKTGAEVEDHDNVDPEQQLAE